MANIIKTSGHQAVVACVPGGSRFAGIGLADAVVAPRAAVAFREVHSERPRQASAVAVAERRDAYAAAAAAHAAHGASTRNQLFGQQKTQLLTMWALRGLDPWSDPT